MKRFLFERRITEVAGTQTYYVDAETPEEALQMMRADGGTLYFEEVEVMDLGEPQPCGETTLDVFCDVAALPITGDQG